VREKHAGTGNFLEALDSEDSIGGEEQKGRSDHAGMSYACVSPGLSMAQSHFYEGKVLTILCGGSAAVTAICRPGSDPVSEEMYSRTADNYHRAHAGCRGLKGD
jgi:hypothetical protein